MSMISVIGSGSVGFGCGFGGTGPESGISLKGQIGWSDLAVPGGIGGGFGAVGGGFGDFGYGISWKGQIGRSDLAVPGGVGGGFGGFGGPGLPCWRWIWISFDFV
jgi:hypothetical protein